MAKPSQRDYGMLLKGLNPNNNADNAAYTEYLKEAYSDTSSQAYKEAREISRDVTAVLSTGSNTDTRDWDKIISSSVDPSTGKVDGSKLQATAIAAEAQMYGGTGVKQIPDSISFGIYGNDGTLLRVLSGSEKTMGNSLKDFGIQDNSWVSTATESLNNTINNIDAETTSLQTVLQSDTASTEQKEEAQQKIYELKATKTNASRFLDTFLPKFADSEYYAQYQPFTGYEDVLQTSYVTGLSQPIETRIEQFEEPEDTQGVVEQTIVSPEVMTPGTTNVAVPEAVYQEAPQAAAAVPVTPSYTQPTTTPYIATPTTITGQTVPTGVEGTGVYPQAPVSGTTSAPLQTAGLSAVPATVQARPDYTGTTMSNLTSQSQQGFGGMRTYENKTTGQQMMITVDAAGNPLTYVPPNFTLKQGMYEGGAVQGYAEGGTVDTALITIAKMNGFDGTNIASAKAFMNSSEGLRRKARAIGVAMNQGGYINKGFAEGGSVPNQAVIGGQPHRLAYVNPQEEEMMKAAGGAGIPSYGGIPAYVQVVNPGSASGAQITAANSTDTGGTVESYEDGDTTKYRINYPTSNGVDGYASEADALAKLNEYNTTTAENKLRADQMQGMQQGLVNQTMQPIQAPVSYIQPQAADFIASTAGQATPGTYGSSCTSK